MNLVLIPNWVISALESENYSVKDALNADKLMSTLSMEDVAFYIWLNQQLDIWIPKDIIKSFTTGVDGMGFSHDVTKQFNDLLLACDIEYANKVGNHQPVKQSADLFGFLSNPVEINKISFFVKQIDMNTLCLIPTISTENSTVGLINDLIYFLNNQLPFYEIAKKPIFKFYLSNI